MRIASVKSYLSSWFCRRPAGGELVWVASSSELLTQSIVAAKRAPSRRIIIETPFQTLRFGHQLIFLKEGKLYVFRKAIRFMREKQYHAMCGIYASTGTLGLAEIEASEISLNREQRSAFFKSIEPASISPVAILIHPFFKVPSPKETWEETKCVQIYTEAIHPMILGALRELRIDPSALMVDLGGGEGLLAEKIAGEYSNPLLVIEQNEAQARKAEVRLGSRAQVAKGNAAIIKAVAARRFAGKKPGIIILSGLATFQVLSEEDGLAIIKEAFESLDAGGFLILAGRMPTLWNAGDFSRAGFVLRKTFDLDRFLNRGEYFEIYVIEKQAQGIVNFDQLISSGMRSHGWEKDFGFWEAESKKPEIMWARNEPQNVFQF